MLKTLSLFLIVSAAFLLSGCGLVYKPTGSVLTHYSQDEVVPYVAGDGDLNLAACGTGMGLGQLLGSFDRVISRPSRVLVNTGLLAGLCSEAQAQEEKLRFARALRRGDTAEARDARIQSQRLFRRTAERRLKVYHETVAAFGEMGDGECPSYGSDTEAFEHVVGTLTSVQALLSDIKAASSVGVPKDVAARAGRETRCMDNKRWWGIPNALQAVVWLSVPGTTPDNQDPWNQLQQAADYGASKGMPLAAVLYAIAGYNQSDKDKEKTAIRQVAQTYNDDSGPKAYRILSAVAHAQALFLSDRLWTAATGQRTPFQGLGTFPGDDKAGGASDASFDAGDYLN